MTVSNVLFGGLPLNVAISVPPMNTGLIPNGFPGTGGNVLGGGGNCIPPSSLPPAPCCPLAPGNGIGQIFQGQNPVSVVALAPLPAFVMVVMGTGGVVLADITNPAHRDVVWGINIASVNSGQLASIVWAGPVVNNINGTGGWNWVVNEPVYVAANGVLSQTPPATGWVLAIGFALSMNTLNLFPSRASASTAANNAPRVSVLPFSANVNLDFSAAEVFDLTLTGSTVLSMNGGIDGRTIVLRVSQDATGNRVMNLDTDIITGSGYTPVPASGGSRARYTFQYDGATASYVCTGSVTL